MGGKPRAPPPVHSRTAARGGRRTETLQAGSDTARPADKQRAHRQRRSATSRATAARPGVRLRPSPTMGVRSGHPSPHGRTPIPGGQGVGAPSSSTPSPGKPPAIHTYMARAARARNTTRSHQMAAVVPHAKGASVPELVGHEDDFFKGGMGETVRSRPAPNKKPQRYAKHIYRAPPPRRTGRLDPKRGFWT